MEKSSNFRREGTWKLVSYGFRREDLSWSTTTADDNLYLTLKNMNLMLLRGDTLLESFSFLSNEIQRIVSCRDSIAITIKQELLVRHLRFRFAETIFFSGEAVCSQCINTLDHYATVGRNSGDTDDCIERRQNYTISLSNHVLELLKKKEAKLDSGHKDFSTVYPIEQIIEDCILDSDFPKFVTEVVDILSSKQKIH